MAIVNEAEREGFAVLVRREDADVEIRKITFGQPQGPLQSGPTTPTC